MESSRNNPLDGVEHLRRHRMGIDLGGTKVEAVVLDSVGDVIVRERRPTPVSNGYDAIIRAIAALVGDIETKINHKCHVGIGTPGAIIPESGLLKNSNTVCMNGQPVHRDLESVLSRPVRIENDANCFALSEATNGAGKGASVVFGVIMGTGVGGAIVVDGKLVSGLHHIAGEWGHNQLEATGPRCYCGRDGCVETLLSGPGIAADYQRIRSAGDNSGSPGEFNSDVTIEPDRSDQPIDARRITELAESGDIYAQQTIDRFLQRFGRAMAYIVNILDPQIIVLGGGVSNIDAIYDKGRDYMTQHVFTDVCRTSLLRNLHGDSSGVFGAAMLWSNDEQAS